MKKIISMILCFSFVFNATTHAYHSDNNSNNIILLKDSVAETPNKYHWELINGKWYYKDDLGNVLAGRYIDEFGDIYDTEGNYDNSIIVSGKNSLGESFDHNGREINPSMVNSDLYQYMVIQYENGETLRFNAQTDFLQFIEYYTVQYRLSTYNAPYQLIQKNDFLTSTLADEYRYDREYIVNKIFTRFGTVVGNNDYDKIIDACDRVSQIIYDDSNTYCDVNSCIDTNKGVCWHYAKIASVLLDGAGIYNELMAGNFQGSSHMWLRCKVDDKWVYVDPVNYKSGSHSYANINYQDYLKNYIVKFSTFIKK